MKLYHLTTEEFLPRIQQEGLVPRIGDNSILLGDTVPAVHLTNQEGVAYWHILCDRDIVVSVDIEPDVTEYGENKSLINYICYNAVEASKCVSVCKIISYDIVAMRHLCVSHLNRLCLFLQRLSLSVMDDEECLSQISPYITLLERLDFTYISTIEFYNNYGGTLLWYAERLRKIYDDTRITLLCDYVEREFSRFCTDKKKGSAIHEAVSLN